MDGFGSVKNIESLTSNAYETRDTSEAYSPKIPLDDGSWLDANTILQDIADMQETIEQERLAKYEVSIGTNTFGTIPFVAHKMTPDFPTYFSCSFLVDGEGRHEVSINHYTDDYNDVHWSLISPYTLGQQAKITLVGKTADATESEQILINRYAYGIQFTNTAVGMTTPTRVGNLSLHKTLPVQSKMSGCIWNQNDGIRYYLDADDWSKKEDGTASVLDGSDGDIMVDTGAKSYIRYIIDGTTCSVYISEYQLTSQWIEIPRMLIDAFKGMLIDNKWRSIVSPMYRGGKGRTDYDTLWGASTLGKPKTTINRANVLTACANAGKTMWFYEANKVVLYWWYVIEFCSFNSQASFVEPVEGDYHTGGLGRGISDIWSWDTFNKYNPTIPNGFGIGSILSSRATLPVPSAFDHTHKGNKTFAISITVDDIQNNGSTTQQTIPSYRGIFEPIGGIFTNLHGVVGRGNSVYSSWDPTKFANMDRHSGVEYDWVNDGGLDFAGHRATSNGYGGSLAVDRLQVEAFPNTVQSNIYAGTYDSYTYAGIGNTDYRFIVGGDATSTTASGLGGCSSGGGVSSASEYVGARGCVLL